MAARSGAQRRPRFLALVVVVIVVLLGVGGTLVRLYTDLLWFREVGFSGVFSTTLRTQLMLFVVGGALMATVVGANIVMAHRLRPPFRPTSLEQQNLERYRIAVEPLQRLALLLVTGFLGVIAGAAVAGRWETWLLWRNAVQFGSNDPQFTRDVSYFAFTYPFQRLVLNFFFISIALSLVAALITHYLYGGIRLQTRGERVVAAARAHISVLLGVFVLLKAFAYYLDQYGLAFSSRGVVTGASYTDVNAQLPALRILVVIAVICAALFIANLRSRGWFLPATGMAVLVLSSIVIGGVYPFAIQYARVRPNEIGREAPYIQRNIDRTRLAYGIDQVKPVAYAAKTTATPAELRADKGTIPNARLLDPNVVKESFEQLQGIRGYYSFADSLDIDRYTLPGGVAQDYVVAVRELDQEGLNPAQRNWINRHLIYTHGVGFVAARANVVETDGRPTFTARNIPNEGPIRIDQPRIYYGERNRDYALVGTKQQELDIPSGGGEGTSTTTYTGKGGVPLGGALRRLLFAARFGEKNLLLSGALTNESRVLFNRDPRQRVQKVAPYLTLDSDPYPAIIDGRVVWIVDGYTTTDGFPYSQRQGFGELATDSRTAATTQREINYIRNSVKATVDAYDGTVTLYAWDEQDPILRTWRRAFPGSVQPRSAMSPELIAHVRYPEDFFKVQRELLSRYHVTDPQEFYIGDSFWAVPDDPNSETNETTAGPQPPFYLMLQAPGQARPSFNLTTALVFARRANLAAWIAVSSDPDDYGTFRVLQLPSGTTVPGPAQVVNDFESVTRASTELSQLRSGGSSVTLGNLLTLPVGGGFLYVEPVYVQAKGDNAFPILRRVFVGFGDKVGYAETLAGALAEVFGAQVTPTPTTPTTPTTPGTGTNAALDAAIADAQKAYDDGQAALARGDFTAYGQAQQRLKAALDRAAAASRSTASPSPTSSSSPTATASP